MKGLEEALISDITSLGLRSEHVAVFGIINSLGFERRVNLLHLFKHERVDFNFLE